MLVRIVAMIVLLAIVLVAIVLVMIVGTSDQFEPGTKVAIELLAILCNELIYFRMQNNFCSFHIEESSRCDSGVCV